MKRPIHLLVAVVAAAAVLVPARADAAQGVARIETPPEGITALLRDYGRAWRTHDASLLDRALAPGKYRNEQLRALRNAAAVPFKVFDAAAETHYSGNLASLRVRKKYPGKQVRAYEVTIRTSFDIEDKPSVGDGAFTFVRDESDSDDRYDGWRLISDSDMDDLAFFTSKYLWDDGPVAVRRSPHFLILARPDVARSLEAMTSIAERSD